MSTPLPLAPDFADRIETLRAHAEQSGHSDLDHLLEMAVAIARLRIDAEGAPRAIVDSEILRPHVAASPGQR